MSPLAPKRPCAGGCGALVRHGRCASCTKVTEQRRGTANARGYTYRDWQPFRRRFLALLVEADILPVCGAALPSGPAARESACRDAQIATFTSADGSSLHLDHEPKLEDWERHDPARVCDPTRIVLKCAECHNRKTAKEMQNR